MGFFDKKSYNFFDRSFDINRDREISLGEEYIAREILGEFDEPKPFSLEDDENVFVSGNDAFDDDFDDNDDDFDDDF